jgi:DNA-binding transcriptional LysR family regulator
MVASGLGPGLLRRDQAEQAERNGELRIWPGWRSHTWLCWVEPEGRRAPAVDAVRAAVLDTWA